MKVHAAKVEKEFEQEESKYLFAAYTEISNYVTRFANQNGYVLVLNFSRDVVHEDIPADVRYGISKPVVFNAPDLDITNYINPVFAGAATAPAVGQGPVPGNPAVRPETARNPLERRLSRPLGRRWS